ASAALVVPLPGALLTLVLAGVTLGLELTLPYHRYARVLRWLALSLLAHVFGLAAVGVDWSEVLRHTLSPTWPDRRAQLAALLAVFGTTVSPYLFFWQASEEVEEQRDHDQPHPNGSGPTEDQIRAMRVDVIGGMASACAIAFAIMVTSAATLHVHGITDI